MLLKFDEKPNQIRYDRPMTEKRYDVVFRGRLTADAAEDEVKARLARLFKSTAAQIDRLFQGGRVVIKKNLTREQAETYREALRKSGAVVSLVSAKGAEPTPTPPAESVPATASAAGATVPPASSSRASFAVDDPAEPTPAFQVKEIPNAGRARFAVDGDAQAAASPTPSSAPVPSEAEGPEPNSEDNNDGGIQLAAVGSRVAEPAEKVEIDISTDHLASSEINAPLDDSDRPAAPSIDTDHLQAATSEAALDQRPPTSAPAIDTDHLSAAQVDEQLDTSERPAAPEIDTDHLSSEVSDAALDTSVKPAEPSIDTSHLALDE